MEDKHIHLKEGITNQEVFDSYIEKCENMNLEKVVFLDHGNRISKKHNPVLANKETIEAFNKKIDTYNSNNTNKKLTINKGIEIDYSNDLNFRKETEEILSYGNFEVVIGAIHSMKFDTLGGYLEAVIDMINNYKINIVAHLKLDDTYKEYKDLISETLKLCQEKKISIEINTSDRSRWTEEQLYFMLDLLEEYNVSYTFGSDAHKVEEIGYKVEETRKKVETWKQQRENY